jgi:hypothetical protein
VAVSAWASASAAGGIRTIVAAAVGIPNATGGDYFLRLLTNTGSVPSEMAGQSARFDFPT